MGDNEGNDTFERTGHIGENQRVGDLRDLFREGRFGVSDEDIRLFLALGDYCSRGENASRITNFPGYFSLTPEYRAIMARGSRENGDKSKSLLAIIAHLDEIERLKQSHSVGSLVDGIDHSLEIIKQYITPDLVEALAKSAGWQGYNPMDPAQRNFEYIKEWIHIKMEDDPSMAHFVAEEENDILEELQSTFIEGVLDKSKKTVYA